MLGVYTSGLQHLSSFLRIICSSKQTIPCQAFIQSVSFSRMHNIILCCLQSWHTWPACKHTHIMHYCVLFGSEKISRNVVA